MNRRFLLIKCCKQDHREMTLGTIKGLILGSHLATVKAKHILFVHLMEMVVKIYSVLFKSICRNLLAGTAIRRYPAGLKVKARAVLALCSVRA